MLEDEARGDIFRRIMDKYCTLSALAGESRAMAKAAAILNISYRMWPQFEEYWSGLHSSGKRSAIVILDRILCMSGQDRWVARSFLVKELTKRKPGKRKAIMTEVELKRKLTKLESLKIIESDRNEKGRVFYRRVTPKLSIFLSTDPEAVERVITELMTTRALAVEYGARLGLEPIQIREEIRKRLEARKTALNQ